MGCYHDLQVVEPGAKAYDLAGIHLPFDDSPSFVKFDKSIKDHIFSPET